MNIVFRVDASIDIGTGHVMRCMSLATSLKEIGANCLFICREHEGNLISYIRNNNFETIALKNQNKTYLENKSKRSLAHEHWLGIDWKTDATETISAFTSTPLDWLVVDHYGLDARWESKLRPYTKNILIVDDLADRMHDCDIILDQNLGRKISDYSNLISEKTLKLIGPQYAPLRPEFLLSRKTVLAKREISKLDKIFIFMGGMDKNNITNKVLTSLSKCNNLSLSKIFVLIGPNSPWQRNIQELTNKSSLPIKLIIGTQEIYKYMIKSDLAIGAAGISSWERCCLGLPSIIMTIADNQKEGAIALNRSEAAILITNEDLYNGVLEKHINTLSDPHILKKMSINASEVCDGRGASRIVRAMVSIDSNPLKD